MITEKIIQREIIRNIMMGVQPEYLILSVQCAERLLHEKAVTPNGGNIHYTLHDTGETTWYKSKKELQLPIIVVDDVPFDCRVGIGTIGLHTFARKSIAWETKKPPVPAPPSQTFTLDYPLT